MGRRRLLLLLATLLFGVIVAYLTVQNWAGTTVVPILDVPSGHQEVAWIAPATSGDAWERLVAALELLQKEAPAGTGVLRVNLDNAFLPLTADVPEVSLYLDGAPDQKLWIRWYKLSGVNSSRRWLEKLSQRARPPLAVIGGDTSDHALFQSRALAEVRRFWHGPAPLYFITTATAERYYPNAYQAGEVPHATWPKLMEVYAKRTFRFCFTNTRMVEAALDFLHQNPQVCMQRRLDAPLSAGIVGQGSLLGDLTLLAAGGKWQPYFLSTLAWNDNGYSKDLAELFLQVFAAHTSRRPAPFNDFYNSYIEYSVGDFLEPNPREAIEAGLFLEYHRARPQPQLLALPTGVQPARRFLRALCRRAPLEMRNVVVVTGDAISFNNIYRDRNVVWNIQDMPVPLVFFSHRNPIDAKAGFGDKGADGTVNNAATHEILLNRDILETLILAAFGRPGSEGSGTPGLAADADVFLERLLHTRWSKGRIQNDLRALPAAQSVPFFDGDGDRRADTGEHIVWLQPAFDGTRVLPEASITVWRAGGDRSDRTWRTFAAPLHVYYNRPNQEEANGHAP